jgi:hypothetical protein
MFDSTPAARPAASGPTAATAGGAGSAVSWRSVPHLVAEGGAGGLYSKRELLVLRVRTIPPASSSRRSSLDRLTLCARPRGSKRLSHELGSGSSSCASASLMRLASPPGGATVPGGASDWQRGDALSEMETVY